MIEQVLELLQGYSLSKRDIGEYAKIDKSGMHFAIEVMEIEKVGTISMVKMRAMLGLMRMETIVVTPLEVDMPLLSFDGIKSLGNDTLLFELLDTQLDAYDMSPFAAIKEKYSNLPDYSTEPRWYDSLHLPGTLAKRGRKIGAELEALEREYFAAFINAIPKAKPCDRKLKQAKVYDYVDNLVTQGGPAIDQFKKMLGEEKASLLFKKHIFGAED